MRYSAIIVALCTLSVLAQPTKPLDPVDIAAAEEVVSAIAGTVALPELFAALDIVPIEAVKKRGVEVDAAAERHGKCKNKTKVKWKNNLGHHCKIKCKSAGNHASQPRADFDFSHAGKHGRCFNHGDKSCKKNGQRPWDLYPNEHHYKMNWQGPNGEDCKETCHKRKCKIEGPAACHGPCAPEGTKECRQENLQERLHQIMQNEENCGRLSKAHGQGGEDEEE